MPRYLRHLKNELKKELRGLSSENLCPPPQPPNDPSSAAFHVGEYRDILSEWGVPQEEIDEKINTWFTQLFYGDAKKERLYYEMKEEHDAAYIWDVMSDDVRTEGISYGMMITVQLNKKDEFDKLWTFARRHMYHESGGWKGYFAWHTKTDGTNIDDNPASDGEIWIVTALFFAAGRWGNGEGIYNYQSEANTILRTMLHKDEEELEPSDDGEEGKRVARNLYDADTKLVVFVPEHGHPMLNFTDPSYHAPHYYELWSRWADQDREFWTEAAEAARQHWRKAVHPDTGLMSNYTEFDGRPKEWEEYGGIFYCDAWRTAMMIAMDHSWFASKDHGEWQVEQTNRYLEFFHNEGIGKYKGKFYINGTTPGKKKAGEGLIAMNASAALASSEGFAWDFVEEFWDTKLPTGGARYYDGMLMMIALLQVSGNFRIYAPPTREAVEVSLSVS